MMSYAEQKAYSRGYAAGKRFAARNVASCLSEIRALPRFRMYVLVDGDCPPSGNNLQELTGVRWSELHAILEKYDA